MSCSADKNVTPEKRSAVPLFAVSDTQNAYDTDMELLRLTSLK